MNIGRIVFPQLDRHSKRLPGSIKKGLVHSLPPNHPIKPPKL